MDLGWKPHQMEILGAVTDRQISGLRLFLSVTALLAIYFDQSDSDRFLRLTYAVLVVYTLYGVLVYCVARQVGVFSQLTTALLVSADVLLYSLLISLSSSTNSIFFYFYFFVIAATCSRLGADAGVSITIVSTFLFVALGYFAAPMGSYEWNRLVMRPVSLILLGYVLTYWARAEQRLRRNLELLRQVSLTANPRFGVDRTAGYFMERMLHFFKADTCILLESDRETEWHQLRCATARNPKAGIEIVPAPENITDILRAIPNLGVALYKEKRRIRKYVATYRVWYPANNVIEHRAVEEASTLVEWLGSRSLIVVPLRHHEWFRGYLFLGAERPGAFRMEDAKFLRQVADQVAPVLEHIRLVDRMASDASDEERRRIARSVHDRVIQPYIGLQMGLMGVRRLVQSVAEGKDSKVAAEQGQQAMAALENLVSMARDGVEELRQYVYGLRNTKARGDVLVESLLRYAAKFETVTGIRVSVINRLDCTDINDRLTGEIFQMASEALSNVHRHTTATSVTLTVEGSLDGSVAVRIENETPEDTANREFLPRSIAERAESLGGHTHVSTANGRTVVQIEIPL
jgi:signal transduction histidine kinase